MFTERVLGIGGGGLIGRGGVYVDLIGRAMEGVYHHKK